MFVDGVNSHSAACDYKKCDAKIFAAGKLKVSLAQGGGFVVKIECSPHNR